MQNLNTDSNNSEIKLGYFRFNKDLISLIFLFILSVYFIYFTFILPIQLFFLLLLPVFWWSKKDYFWFAFVFILINEPGRFFLGGSYEMINRIPLYRLAPGLAFSFYDFFIILALIKSIVKGVKPNLLFKKPLQLLLAYALFLFCFSIISGISFDNLISLSRTAITYTLIYSISSLLTNKEDLYKIVHLIMPFTFLIVFVQFYEVINQKAFITLFDPSRDVKILSWDENVRPVMKGVLIIFFSYIFSLFFLSKKNYHGSKAYLYIIITTCFISVIISGSRSWIGMFLSILVLYYLFIEKLKSKIIFSSLFVLIFVLIAYNVLPVFQSAIDVGFSRFKTVQYIVEGDITAGGTLQRFDVRLPVVLKGFYQNPIIGWGFSDTYYKYMDPHVGNFNLLLQAGILGFMVFLYFWITSIKVIVKTYKLAPSFNEYKKSILVFILGIIGMLILHFTSFEFFSYTSLLPLQVFIIYYFAICTRFIFFQSSSINRSL